MKNRFIAPRTRSVSLLYTLAGKKPKDYFQRICSTYPPFHHLLTEFYSIPDYQAECLAIGAVTLNNGVRVSEVLKLKKRNIMLNGLAVIEPSKGSSARTIYLGLSPQDIDDLYEVPDNTPVFSQSYKRVWATLTRFGLVDKQEGRIYNTVTHSGRYGLAKLVAEKFGEAVASEVLGHKSKESIDHYLNKVDLKKERERKARARKRAVQQVHTVEPLDYYLDKTLFGGF